jgi:hypothetical protein
MITVRRSEDRGHAEHGWLDSHHTFSFGGYYDPEHVGFRNLRVINEDRVAAGEGFPTHPHRDMEILSYVLEGQLGHRDSMKNGSVIRPGDVQRMTAGTGVAHSEMNASETEGVHFLQIWLLPKAPRLTPGYEQKTFATDQALTLVASPDGSHDSVTLNADAKIWVARKDVTVALAPDRHGWVQVTRGTFTVNGETLSPGDGAALSEVGEVTLKGEGEALIFELP